MEWCVIFNQIARIFLYNLKYQCVIDKVADFERGKKKLRKIREEKNEKKLFIIKK